MEIIKALNLVSGDVGGVSKSERNAQQGFNFRGIDAIVNACSPAFRKHGVVVVPCVIESTYGTVVIGKNQTAMGHARVTVSYTFYASDGSNVIATVAAESMDAGDKATAKAMSVAFRTALLQALCLPTDDKDPDHESFERGAAHEPTVTQSTNERGDVTTRTEYPKPMQSTSLASPKQKGLIRALAGGRDLVGRAMIVEMQTICQDDTLEMDNMSVTQASAVIGAWKVGG